MIKHFNETGIILYGVDYYFTLAEQFLSLIALWNGGPEGYNRIVSL